MGARIITARWQPSEIWICGNASYTVIWYNEDVHVNLSEVMELAFMCFWLFMFICDVITPIIMIVAGRMMWKHCPKNINGIVGYRTTRSKKNMDTWKYAHEYCGKLWWKIGWLMVIPSALILIPLVKSNENTVGFASGIMVTIQCVILIISIFPTETALKKHFNDDGTRK